MPTPSSGIRSRASIRSSLRSPTETIAEIVAYDQRLPVTLITLRAYRGSRSFLRLREPFGKTVTVY